MYHTMEQMGYGANVDFYICPNMYLTNVLAPVAI